MKKIYVLMAAIMATDAAAYQDTSGASAKTATTPYDSLQPILSSTLPDNVPAHTESPTDPVQSRPYFDYFSWQSFIALAWPADTATRGAPLSPNAADTFNNAYPLTNAVSTIPAVFMSWRDVTQLFPPSGVPVNWDSTKPAYSPCTNTGSTIPYIRDSVASDTNEAGLYAADDVPVIDQNKNYARFETKFNQTEYTQVVDKKWYIQSTRAITLPTGSIEIKAAWRKMASGDDLSRYYVVNMLATDPNTPIGQHACTLQPMGLIGFHIMHKTKDQPQWVWSTFEQVDNVGFNNDPHAPGSFTNGKPNQNAIDYGYSYKPAQLPPTVENPDPVIVTRIAPIPTTPTATTTNFPDGVSTVGMNQTYRALLGKTIWTHYQLVATQWPSDPSQTAKGGKPFPSTSVANTVIETYGQSPSAPTCMGCHVSAKNNNKSRDYSWTLAIRPRNSGLTRVKKSKAASDKQNNPY